MPATSTWSSPSSSRPPPSSRTSSAAGAADLPAPSGNTALQVRSIHRCIRYSPAS
jgi:hypothetical protein